MDDEYQKVHKLKEGETCCGCISLELGYHFIGVYAFSAAIYYTIALVLSISTGVLYIIFINSIICIWFIIYGFIWLSSFLVRK